MGRQALHLSFRESVGAALPEAASADLDSGRDQPRNRGLVRRASLSLYRSRYRAAGDSRIVESLRRHGGQEGYTAGSENFGYLQQIFVAETEEKAQELGKGALFGGGAQNFSRPEHTLPPGYNSKEATRRLAKQATEYGFLGITSEKLAETGHGGVQNLHKEKGNTRERLKRGEVSVEEAKAKIYANYQKAQDGLQIIIGTPKIGDAETPADYGSAAAGNLRALHGAGTGIRAGSTEQRAPDGPGSAAGDARVCARNSASRTPSR